MRCSVFFLHFISQPNHSVFFALSVFGLSLFGFPMNASFWCTVYSCVSRDVCLLIFFFSVLYFIMCFLVSNRNASTLALYCFFFSLFDIIVSHFEMGLRYGDGLIWCILLTVEWERGYAIVSRWRWTDMLAEKLAGSHDNQQEMAEYEILNEDVVGWGHSVQMKTEYR